MTKRFPLLSGLLGGLVLAAPAQPPALSPHFAGNRLYADVQRYVALGEHRTASPVDSATGEWITAELTAAGFRTSYSPFPLKQFFLDHCAIRTPTAALRGFPLWYVGDHAAQPQSGVLVDSRQEKNSEVFRGKIVLTRFPSPGGQQNGVTTRILQPIVAGGAKAIVVITENPVGDVVAYNALRSLAPWPVPVVLAAPRDSTALLDAVARGESVTVTLAGSLRNVHARNILGRLGNGPKYVVISTPISGWFTCGGERGPGLAVFLALARWLGQQPKLPYTFLFTANSGHELDNQGAHHFLERVAPPPDSVRLWLHLGAGIATLRPVPPGPETDRRTEADPNRNLMYSASLEAVVQRTFAGVAARRWNVEQEALGELGVVAARGYHRLVGIAHGHHLHHMPSDNAQTTSPAILEEIGLAVGRFLQSELQLKE